ncbi:unnamed protein product [Auanema sp. JU1783]|nr:unnamed protein product [Auanema sp. JU1783]
MRKILAICLCLATYLHTGSTSSANISTTAPPVDSTRVDAFPTTPSSPFNMDEELAKIATSCLTHADHEQLSGNFMKHIHVAGFNYLLITEAVDLIANTEMRAALGFSPPGPWTKYEKPSADELKSAYTVEEYFDLKERSINRSLDSLFFFEKNLPPAVVFLDNRFPAIRTICKRKFQEVLQVNLGGKIDRKLVDDIIFEYNNHIYPKFNDAISKMLRARDECYGNNESL